MKKINRERNTITTGFHIPYNPKLKNRARELRKNMTEAEKKIWYAFLRGFKHRFLRQKPIDNYIVDFYCTGLKLVIEIDGDTHSTKEEIEYDKYRTQILEGYGLKVIRFTNYQIFNNFDEVCNEIESIENIILKSPQPPAVPEVTGSNPVGIATGRREKADL